MRIHNSLKDMALAWIFYQGQDVPVWRRHGGAVWSLPNGVAQMPWSGFFGTDWRGPFATRPADHFYTSWQIGNFGNAYAKSLGQSAVGAFEAVLNAGYIFQLSEEFSVQPDIQYIIRPGGFGQSANALVPGFQVSLNL